MIACITGTIVLAIAWLVVTHSYSLGNLLTGLVIGLALTLLTPAGNTGRVRLRPITYLRLVGRFLVDIVQGTAQLCVAVLRREPVKAMHPAIVGVPLELKRDAPLMMMANLFTLTPSTLSITVDSKRERLYLHSLLEPNPDAIAPDLKRDYETPLLRLYAEGRERE